MLGTATAVESVDREMINAKYAATIPAICKLLPTAIESRPNSLRLVPSPRFIVLTLAVSRKILIIVEIRRFHQLLGKGSFRQSSLVKWRYYVNSGIIADLGRAAVGLVS